MAHPHVVVVRDSFTEGPWAVIVMELARCSMAELVEERGPLPVEALLDLATQVCAGLAAAHAAGVVHRDVKPHNLLLFSGGVVKLCDFGVAHAAGHARTRTGNVIGSMPFMAPEQRRYPRAVRPATDVYGLAHTLVWLHLGRPSGDLYAPGSMGELVEAGMPVALAEVLGRGTRSQGGRLHAIRAVTGARRV